MIRNDTQTPWGWIKIVVCLMLLATPGRAQKQADAAAIVNEFYRFHFANRERLHFSAENIAKEKRWLTRELYAAMRNEFKREKEYQKTHPDEKPYFSGDVFTDSESPPQTFRVDKASEQKTRATVTVIVYWDDQTVGKAERKIEVQLSKQNGKWRIANLVYEHGKDLLSELQRPNYQ